MSQPMKDKRQAPSYKPSVLANEMRVVLGLAVHPSSETGVVSSLLDQAQALGEVEELLVDAGYHCDEVIDETLARDISLLCPQGRTHDEGSWTVKFPSVYLTLRRIRTAVRKGSAGGGGGFPEARPRNVESNALPRTEEKRRRRCAG